jgi:hypothetical protein
MLIALVFAINPITAQAEGWVVLTSDSFESGWGNYTSGGANAVIYTYSSGTNYAHQGSKAADIQSYGTTSFFTRTSSIDVATPGYTQIKVDFWFYAVAMESGDDFWVQYSSNGGTNWSTVASYVSGTNFNNSVFYNKTVTILESSYAFTNNAKIRFICDATSNSTTDDVYIDEIVVYGYDDEDPPVPNPATFATAPVAINPTTITMTATTGTDDTGPVEYYFAETSGNPGGSNSGWQSNPIYNDNGLNPGTQYTYTVQMRDSLGNTGIVSSPQSATTLVTVPDVVGLEQAAAESAITGADLVVGTVTTSYSSTVPLGRIISQNPVGGIAVQPGSSVNITASLGTLTIDMEDLEEFVEHWLDSGCGTCGGADLSGDGDVDFEDFALFAANWLTEPEIPTTLVINEFMASNSSASGVSDPQGDYDDWIEIYNFGNAPIDLAGMYLTDDLDTPTKWQIPSGYSAQTTVPARGFLVIWADEDTLDGPLHANFKLSVEGEDIGLFDTDGNTPIDTLTFGGQTTNISYGRYPDASDNWRFFPVPTAGAINNGAYTGVIEDVEFSHMRGFYSTSFNLTMACVTPGVSIYYTTDGKPPIIGEASVPSATLYTVPVAVNGTKCVRAAAIKTGWMPSNINTQTYLFLADVITQSPTGSAPTGWPTGPINGQVIDYGMDPDVVNNGLYVGLVDDALLAIPTISLVTDLANLFDPATGIYVNAVEHGDEATGWERPVSVELINPDGSEGFQIDAGLRIRGGYSRNPWNPKHAFRLFFRSEYGKEKLNYPLFGDEGVDEFEKIDLSTAQNYSWSFYGDYHNTMLRDIFSRDTQGQMGQPYTRSRYYHLYIDGQYWGIYLTQERPEARYAASYFGGNAEDYDTVKPIGYPEPGNYTIEATDGNLVAYDNLWDAATAGFASDSAYYQVQGLNTDGTRNPAYKVQLDVNNLIDYMLNTFYTGDFDAPITMWESGINNFFAIYNRNGQDGWKFFKHDAEHSLFAHVPGFDPRGWGNNPSIDRTGPWGYFSDFPRFNPQWLHERLTLNAEYRMRFADRTYKHFFNEGPLEASAAVATITARKNQIDSAIIAESARWGDAKVHPPRTRDSDWLPEINTLISNFFPTRVGDVIAQLRNDGWYPNIDPPVFNQRGGHVSGGFSLTMTNPNGSGTIYYTTNGIDPRGIGGAAVGTAYTVPIALNASVQVKARVLKDSTTWSALNEVTFAVGPVAEKLRITEIMYHPLDTGNPNDPNKEFIELKNIGTSAINLNLVKFTNGVEFTFPNRSLAAGGYVLVVKNQAAFVARYGSGLNSIIAGQYTGSLDNAGERIRLEDANAIGQVILDFEYKDGWYPITDGNDFTLNIINPANPEPNSWDLEESWQASNVKGGSPGAAYASNVAANGAIVINELLTHTDSAGGDWIELRNTTGSAINIGGWFLSDDFDDLRKYEIAAGTTIPANGYKVFTEDANFGTAFGLSELGEQVFLSSGSAGQLSGGYSIKQEFGAMTKDVTIGRYTKSAAAGYDVDFTAMASATKGAANSAPLVPGVVINEIMYHSGNQHDKLVEYIELYNRSGSTVNLYDVNNPTNTWKFTNGIDFTFPTGITMAPGEYLLVSRCNPTIFRVVYSVPGGVQVFGPFADGTELANDGEKVELSKPETPELDGYVPYIRVEQVNYSDGSHPAAGEGSDPWPTTPDGGGQSLGRKVPGNYGNDVNNWQAITPTPGAGG